MYRGFIFAPFFPSGASPSAVAALGRLSGRLFTFFGQNDLPGVFRLFALPDQIAEIGMQIPQRELLPVSAVFLFPGNGKPAGNAKQNPRRCHANAGKDYASVQ
jgi:hypothetical protein